MTAQRSTDSGNDDAIKAAFLEYENGELRALTEAFDNGDYENALDAAKRINAIMRKIKGEGL